MKRFAQFTCMLVIAAASSAAPNSGAPNPTLGYTATGGRGLGLKLANEDGSGTTEVYRFTNGARFDLSSAADRRILIIDNHRLLLTSWSVGSRGITAQTPSVISPTGAQVGAAAFSQDGTKIAYTTVEPGGTGQVVIVSTASPLVQLSRFATPYGYHIAWMPDGNSVVIAAQDNNAPYTYRLLEYAPTGGEPTVLLSEPNINDFDTGRVPGDRNLLVSFSRVGFSAIGVWDPTANSYTSYLPAQGSSATWNCPQTRTTLKNAADEGVYTMDVVTGAKQVIYKGVQGRFPRYMKCNAGVASSAVTARERGRANRFIHISRQQRRRF